ncbi:hypothetical protein HA402_013448 [Bradysia odoriphaga]|nr:hypothetical protein HA402_013448 [Bradysia odoriphaga]
MFEFWVRLLLVITLYNQFTVHSVHGLRAFIEMWAAKCKDSGFIGYNATIDFQNYAEFRQCLSATFNETQFLGDVEAILKEANSPVPEYAAMGTALQKYCAPVKAHLKCSEKLSTECFTEDELFRWKLHSSIGHSILDFFCDNGTAGMTEFINGNGLECYLGRRVTINSCFTEFEMERSVAGLLYKDPFAMFYGVPKAAILCDISRKAGNCILRSLQQCEKSTEPAVLIDKLISYVEMETKCNLQPKVNSSEIIQQSDLWQRWSEAGNNRRSAGVL